MGINKPIKLGCTALLGSQSEAKGMETHVNVYHCGKGIRESKFSWWACWEPNEMILTCRSSSLVLYFSKAGVHATIKAVEPTAAGHVYTDGNEPTCGSVYKLEI